jgi:DNA-binding XRE family transcriptional regulator
MGLDFKQDAMVTQRQLANLLSIKRKQVAKVEIDNEINELLTTSLSEVT